MVNLLPKKETARIISSYYVRFVTSLLLLLSGILFVGGALLIPSYLLAQNTAEAGGRYVRALEETVGLKERTGATSEVRRLAEKTRILNELNLEPVTANFFEDVLNEKPRSVALVGFALSSGKEMAFSVTGIADTRSGLLSFVNALKNNGQMKNVEIPVNQLAVDKDVPFSIKGIYISTP